MTTQYPATPIEAGAASELPVADSHEFVENIEQPADRNNLRARWAAAGVKAYAEAINASNGEPIDTVVGDLLADLRHLMDALKASEDGVESTFDDLVSSSGRRYTEELVGEDLAW